MKFKFWQREKEYVYQEPIRKEPFTYRMSNGWGNAISWLSWDTRRVTGHKSVPPMKGDYLIAELGQGEAVFQFTTVERMHDPPDQFFATVKDIGYLKDIDEKVMAELNRKPTATFLV